MFEKIQNVKNDPVSICEGHHREYWQSKDWGETYICQICSREFATGTSHGKVSRVINTPKEKQNVRT